jgi:hypothetical protein
MLECYDQRSHSENRMSPKGARVIGVIFSECDIDNASFASFTAGLQIEVKPNATFTIP